jgi:hypothetical protein
MDVVGELFPEPPPKTVHIMIKAPGKSPARTSVFILLLDCSLLPSSAYVLTDANLIFVHATIDVAPAATVSNSMPGYEKLYEELWGKGNEFCGIKDFTVLVPCQKFYREPAYGLRMRRANLDFPLIGVSPENDKGFFKKLQTKNTMPCSTDRLLIRSEYDLVVTKLLSAESIRRAHVDPATGYQLPSAILDHEVSGQPGSGVYPWL